MRFLKTNFIFLFHGIASAHRCQSEVGLHSAEKQLYVDEDQYKLMMSGQSWSCQSQSCQSWSCKSASHGVAVLELPVLEPPVLAPQEILHLPNTDDQPVEDHELQMLQLPMNRHAMEANDGHAANNIRSPKEQMFKARQSPPNVESFL